MNGREGVFGKLCAQNRGAQLDGAEELMSAVLGLVLLGAGCSHCATQQCHFPEQEAGALGVKSAVLP